MNDHHQPIKLSPAERADLASITRHPGMVVLQKILAGHYMTELQSIHKVARDDRDRAIKIAAIVSMADAMKLNIEMVDKELKYNWDLLAAEEVQHRKESQKNATPKGKKK